MGFGSRLDQGLFARHLLIHRAAVAQRVAHFPKGRSELPSRTGSRRFSRCTFGGLVRRPRGASKIGSHNLRRIAPRPAAGPLKSPESSLLEEPMAAVREMRGKMPPRRRRCRHLAALEQVLGPAGSTSGRRRSTSEDKAGRNFFFGGVMPLKLSAEVRPALGNASRRSRRFCPRHHLGVAGGIAQGGIHLHVSLAEGSIRARDQGHSAV